MLMINGTHISLTRGDSARLNLKLNNTDGTEYELQDGDKVTLTIKKGVHASEKLFSVDLEDGSFFIPAGATSEWDFGNYVYDVQLSSWGGVVDTLIVSTITLTPEVNVNE